MAGPSEEGEVVTVAAAELRCESCGAPWTMRGFQTTKTVACEHCGSVFETSGQSWQLVQQVEGQYQTRPRYALGTRGKLDGIEWEVIGWSERSVTSWGTRYAWEEHLLYNPYEGFRYLIYQDGHFIVVEAIPGAPTTGVNLARYASLTYRHFSSADAVVDEVLGEFPWEVRRGDVATATDYVDPPFILSSEASRGELVWSAGRYLERAEVLAAFGEPTRKLEPIRSVHPCQPNPHRENTRWMGKALLVGLLVWAVGSAMYLASCDNVVIWKGTVDQAGVSQEVELDTRPYYGTVQLKASAPINNQWCGVAAALVDHETNKAHWIQTELEYYSGPGWTEGSQSGSDVVNGIGNGKYVLQVTVDPNSPYKGAVSVELRRDVPLYRFPCCFVLLLLFGPLIAFAQSRAFEGQRWKESDHAG